METDSEPHWIDSLDSVSHSGVLKSARLDGDEVVIRFFAGRLANTYYTLRIPLDAVDVEQG